MENKNPVTPEQPRIDEHLVRKEKVATMRAEGMEPWPSFKPTDATVAQAVAEHQADATSEKSYALAGRLMTRRDHGKTFFCNLQDRSGTIQIYVKKDIIGDAAFENFKRYVDAGDILWVNGPLFVTKTGEVTVKVHEIALLSKCLHPLPEKFHGLSDIEQRYRQRYLDLISNQESKEKFIKRSKIVQSIREFLQSQDFLEVETPMLHPIPGGAIARPFVTHHNAYDMDLYLRIAPELYLKRLVVGGLERVFEIGRNFRNEGVSTRHNPEFTTLEFYMANGDYKDGMALTEQLIYNAVSKNFASPRIMVQDKEVDFTPPFKRVTMKDSLIQIGGLDAHDIEPANIDTLLQKFELKLHSNAGYGAKIFALFEHCVEGKIVQPTFIIGYPVEVSPLAKRDPQNADLAARFELFACGMELANGFTELNDPFDQAERFKDQVKARECGDQEAHYYDADYVKALEYGLPPTVGVGLGIDRLTMFLTNTGTIKDVILFPTLKNVKD